MASCLITRPINIASRRYMYGDGGLTEQGGKPVATPYRHAVVMLTDRLTRASLYLIKMVTW